MLPIINRSLACSQAAFLLGNDWLALCLSWCGVCGCLQVEVANPGGSFQLKSSQQAKAE